MDAAGCEWQPESHRWRVTGADLQGDDLTLVVVIEQDVVVVTMF